MNHPPHVLFVCVKNGGKSQMAEGLMRHVAGSSVLASSAGTRAGTVLNAESAASLLELGIDITGRAPTQLTPELVADADLVVVLGHDARVGPEVNPSGTPVERWETVEPSLDGVEGMERMRLVRDDILERVTALHERLRSAGPVTTGG